MSGNIYRYFWEIPPTPIYTEQDQAGLKHKAGVKLIRWGWFCFCWLKSPLQVLYIWVIGCLENKISWACIGNTPMKVSFKEVDDYESRIEKLVVVGNIRAVIYRWCRTLGASTRIAMHTHCYRIATLPHFHTTLHTHSLTLLKDCHTATLPHCTALGASTRIAMHTHTATGLPHCNAPGLPCTLTVSHCTLHMHTSVGPQIKSWPIDSAIANFTAFGHTFTIKNYSNPQKRKLDP